MRRRRSAVFLAIVLGGIMGADPPEKVEGRPKVDAAAVAKLPLPGTVVPGAIAFTPDGKAVTYLKSEDASLSRVLWRVEVAPGAEPRVVARAPGGGDTDASVTPEEALRRERQRLRDTGITQVVRAEAADAIIAPLKGDVFLLPGDGKGPLRLTDTPAAEIDPKLTKDGKKAAYVREGNLYALDVATQAETKLTRSAGEGVSNGLAEFVAQEEMDRSSGYWWSPDGTWIAYQQTDERRIPLYSIVHQGGEAVSVETHRYPFAGAANAIVRVGVVAAEGGETRWLDIPGLGEEGEDYLARLEWDAPKTILVQVLGRDQKRLRLSRIDVDSGQSSVLIEETSPTWVNLHDDLRVVAGTGEMVWSSERSGFRHLELHDRDGKLVRELTSGEWAVDAVVGLDEARREVWFAAGKDGPLEMHLYRASLDGGPIRRLTEAPGMHKAVVARDGGHFIDIATSRTSPPKTTLRDREGREVAVLDDAGKDPRVGQLRLEPPQFVEFKNRDGVTLHGAYYAPQSRMLGEKAPLIVMLYGGPHVQLVSDTWGLTADLFAHYLTRRGFAVWKMDNRGSARRGHAFEAALYRNMGSVEVRDQADGVAFVGKTWADEVDISRVGVTGASYGGYMTLRCLTEAPDVFHAGVSLAPVTDWDGYDTCYTERYMGTPKDNPEGYKAASVLTRADALKGKLFVVHGMLDENVHFRHTARLTSALISAGVPFDLLPLPNERHSSRREEDRRYEVERRARFFEDALGRP